MLCCLYLSGKCRFAHYNENFATFTGCPRYPPFAAIEHVLITLAFDCKLDIRSIGTCYIRFGHSECGANFTIQ